MWQSFDFVFHNFTAPSLDSMTFQALKIQNLNSLTVHHGRHVCLLMNAGQEKLMTSYLSLIQQ